MTKCWSEKVLDKLQPIPFIFFDDDLDGIYERVGIIESGNEDGTITVVESLEGSENESE